MGHVSLWDMYGGVSYYGTCIIMGQWIETGIYSTISVFGEFIVL